MSDRSDKKSKGTANGPAKAGRTKPSRTPPKGKKTNRKRPAKREAAGGARRARQTGVKVAAAKGRPMLTWVGKRPLSQVTAFPGQLVERHEAHNILGLVGDEFDTVDKRMKVFQGLRNHWNAECWEGQPSPYGVPVPEAGGVLLHGDNLDCLAMLLAHGYRGKVDLIYIDPPFDSGADYVRKVNLRGAKGGTKLDGESYTLGEQIQYTDIWANDNYLQFMYERFQLLRELLTDKGSVFLHCDAHRSHLLRCLLDEVFAPENFRNEIVREKQRGGKHHVTTSLGSIHDTILHYTKGDAFTWNAFRRQVPERILVERYPHEDEHGRYALADCTNYAVSRPNLTYEFLGFYRTWKWTKEEMQRKHQAGEVVQVEPGRVPRRKVRPSDNGDLLQSLWYDVPDTSRDTDYPTEKSPKLLDRIMCLCSDPGDLVLDAFIGAGTTAAVAQQLGRRWIGCDINKGAIQTTVKRVRGIITEQIGGALADKKKQDGLLIKDPGGEDRAKPCQFGFSVWRVNDYDLQIQHNEAVAIACEHVGVQRSRSDAYFDGTRGRNLVKITPFDHPLSPVDLDEMRRELDARPDEDRGITIVCLGIELGARAWIDDWNRLRKGKDSVNRIEVIELRTDPKYGKFIRHEPARAKVKVARKAGRILVEIRDFISPTIVERLKGQAGVVAPKIDDWRAMVDTVCIDTAYDGKALNVVLADVPQKKTDLVEGTYDLPAPGDDETTVAVRITDMLGEEVLVTEAV